MVMKKILSMMALLSALGIGALSTTSLSFAGEAAPADPVVTTEAAPAEAAPAAEAAAPAEAEAPAPVADKGDTAWMLVATVLVTLMVIPGLALFYGGLVRSKNMLSVLMQTFI